MVKAKKLKKIISVLLILIVLVIVADKYHTYEAEIKSFIRFNEKNIIGHSKSEIIKEYGEFDKVRMLDYEIDGHEVKQNIGRYKVVTGKTGYLGTSNNIYYSIIFSEDDIAIYTEIGAILEEL